MTMLLSLDTIPRLHNILASFFGWLLLAGYVVFPGTFSSLSSSLSSSSSSSSALPSEASHLLVQNTPLLIIASVACGLAAAGLTWLSLTWRRNHVWTLNRVYLPCATSSAAGLVSSLVTVYAQKGGAWSLMARVTAAVEAGVLVVCGGLFVVSALLLRGVRKGHEREVARLEREAAGEGEGEGEGGEGVEEGGKNDVGLLEKAGRKLNRPALEPQSVV